MAILNAPLAFTSASAQSVEVWARALFIEALNQTFFARFAGEGPDHIFQIQTDLNQGPGDTIRIDLLTQEGGYGVNANTQLKGSEQTLSYQQMTVGIEQKRNAQSHFRMSQQRTIHDLRRDAMRNLRDFYARVIDEYVAAFLCGTAGANAALDADITAHGANALAAPDAAHLVDDAGAITPALLNEAKWKAVTIPTANNGPIRPIHIDGEDWYVMFLHPEAAKSLQDNATWLQAQREANLRGERQNPIFTGAMGVWNGMIIHAWNYLPTVAGGTPRNFNVLCGAQALSVAFGQAYSTLDGVPRSANNENGFPMYWAEEIEDYGNEIGISAGTVFGVRKSEFNTFDFGCLRLATNDPAI